MEREGIAAFLIGILGLACVALLAAGPVVYVYKNGFGAIGPGKVDAAKDWKEKVAVDLKKESDIERQIGELGLRERYTVVPFFEGTRDTLYEMGDFATVEARLEAQFAKTDQYERFHYGRCVGDLIDIRTGDDPEHMQAVLNEWVAAYPDSYRARLVRGRFQVDYAWVYRGTDWARNVSSAALERFHHHVELAEADLTAAHQMQPADPNASISMITIAMGRGESDAKVMGHYSRAIAADPLSFMARYRLLYACLPNWGGSWEEVDAIMAEAARSSAAFPMLGVMEREGARVMRPRSKMHVEALDSDDVKRRWVEPYLEQLKLNPGTPLLETNAAFFATEGREFAVAETYFRKLGDTFYEGSNFENLLHYNDLRGYAYAAVANSYPQGMENRRRAAEALEIAPNHYYTNHVYGAALVHEGNYEAAARYFEASMNANLNYPWSVVRLAECAEKRGDRATAVRLARQVADRDPMQGAQDTALAIIKRNS